jgi:hypothetical protein
VPGSTGSRSRDGLGLAALVAGVVGCLGGLALVLYFLFAYSSIGLTRPTVPLVSLRSSAVIVVVSVTGLLAVVAVVLAVVALVGAGRRGASKVVAIFALALGIVAALLTAVNATEVPVMIEREQRSERTLGQLQEYLDCLTELRADCGPFPIE